MYFRYSEFATKFFVMARQFDYNWDYLRLNILKGCREELPTPDVVYSLITKVLGIENCTIPSLDFLNFVHMKSAIQNWTETQPWTDFILVEEDLPILRINNINQYHPIHYYEKDFITDERIALYERKLGIN